ncbi:hypothetical protein [Desulfofustis glycolicus]|uniref:Uncharacterized protein n=1 Tax=Desulfofustis glycolicus DSM 9705 TaxID=1121409 RepID=A0A1M5V7L7_9BACT|nr:hypothetical protein [Desulfofustis glycolicus]MCB2214926.1 hypothetical protein [Desulfobulbaceae bacterium]SHH71216.1 hypothetical protein SAMN02745124_01553 [Desulfofustis glycolicus DSM 9705]
MNRHFDNYLKLLVLIGIGIFLVAVAASLLPAETGAALVRENGSVESATAVLYLIAAFWLLARSFRDNPRWHLTAGLMVVLLLLRELDAHARFTTMGVLKSRYYLSPDVPAGEKAVVSVVMILLLIVVLRFVWRAAPSFFRAVRHRQAPSVAIAAAIGTAVVSKTLDSFSGPIRHVLRPLYHDSKTYLRVYEEIFELAIPLFILLALLFSTASRRDSTKESGVDASRPTG